jgi:hypothetical protein
MCLCGDEIAVSSIWDSSKNRFPCPFLSVLVFCFAYWHRPKILLNEKGNVVIFGLTKLYTEEYTTSLL